MSILKPPSRREQKYAFQSAIFLMVAHLAASLMVFMIGFRNDILQMKQAGLITLIVAISCGFSAILIRRGRISQGGWLMIGVIGLTIPFTSLLMANLGWVSLIAIPLLILWIASQTLPAEKFIWALAIGILSGVSTLLLDVYSPIGRETMPYTGFIIPIAVIGLIAIAARVLLQRFSGFGLNTKLLILFLLVSLIPLGLLAFLNYRSTRSTLTEAANQSLLSTGTQTAKQIDLFFDETTQTLQTEAQFTGLREYLTNIANGEFAFSTDAAITLATLASKDPEHILTYALLDRNGGVYVTYPVTQTPQNVDIVDVVPPFMGVPLAVENGMRTSMAWNQPYVSPVIFNESNQAGIFMVTPVYDILEYTHPVGLLLVEYDAIILQELIESQNGLAGVDSYGVLLDENQLQLAHGTNPEALYKTVATLPFDQVTRLIESGRLPNLPPEELSANQFELSAKLSNATTEPFFTAQDAAGDQINQVAVTKTQSNLWQVGFFQPQNVFLAIINQQVRDTIPVILFFAVVVAIASMGATGLLSSPITNLTELVEHIAAGDMTLQVPVITQDEIGRLAVAFNAMTSQIRSLLSGLEIQVAARTREYERQAVQLQTAAQVARDASNLQNLEDLLNRTVNLIQDRFGFYHAGIFLLDDRGEYAILRAANSEGGKEMLRRDHRLKVGQTGIVGYVTSQGVPRIALDVDSDIAHFAHPLLPETRSEIALPLIVGNRIIGAIDVQSKESNAFDEGDITVLQVLADQLAVAIENSRLLAEVRQTVEELQTAYGSVTQESWQKWGRRANQTTGYRYRGAGIEPTREQSPETVLAIKQGQIITKLAQEPEMAESVLAIPIRLRNQTIGAINLRVEGRELPPEFINLVESVSKRLAVTLESARLYEETQRRAMQEQITSEIASRFRESLDIDTVLKTAVQEIGEKLSLHDVSIEIDVNSNSPSERES